MLSWARESDLASDDGDEIDEGESMLPMFCSGSRCPYESCDNSMEFFQPVLCINSRALVVP